MPKKRLDTLLVERELVETRSLAQRLVMAGQVRVAGQVCLKSSQGVDEEAAIVIDWGPRYVSRGGEKLAAALGSFHLKVEGWICADVGASTGGFTDCLLQNGAKCVFAIDVGKGILHWKLRQDPRVWVMEDTNARYLNRLPESVDLVTIDAAFISLRVLLPVVKNWFSRQPEPEAGCNGQVIALVKPQFEAGRALARRGAGVIRDPQSHRMILEDVLGFSLKAGFALEGLMRSPLLGPKGNVEFLAWMKLRGITDKDQSRQDDMIAVLFN